MLSTLARNVSHEERRVRSTSQAEVDHQRSSFFERMEFEPLGDLLVS